MTEPSAEKVTGDQQPQQQPKTNESSTDWRAEARKWEQRATANQAEVEAFKQAQLSEQEKATRRAEAAEKERDAMATEMTRQRAALAKGVPLNQIHRIIGTTEAELMADAEQLAALLNNTPKIPRADPSQGASGDMALNSDPLLASVKEKLGIT